MFEFLGESIVTLRGEDGRPRSFHNICRHRAARLLTVPNRKTFPGLDLDRHGLAPVEQEIFTGFIFIRLAPGGPSVREMAAPYADEMAAYRMEEVGAARPRYLATKVARLPMYIPTNGGKCGAARYLNWRINRRVNSRTKH
jgi:phenylpropionate dioxygenase-like ring-hydroxylating dioxygenase large terminal subunit